MDLFRKEALEHRAGRLIGDISIAQPLSWTLAGGLIVLAIAGALAALLIVQVPQLAVVPAEITPDGARLLAPGEAAIGMPIVLRPAIAGARIEREGAITAISGPATIATVGGRAAAGRVARARIGGDPLPVGTAAEAIVTIGREPLLSALLG